MLSAALERFGCCHGNGTDETVEELLRHGRAQTHVGHAVRLVAFGSTPPGVPDRRYRVVLLGDVIDGDWAMHCHMTHHVMNQMGENLTNMIGVNARGSDTQVRSLLPNYMTMGQTGMEGMSDMGMAVPPNSIPMLGAPGPFDEITMGGMFTILKVREHLASYEEDPGWYAPPPGTLAAAATEASLRTNHIVPDAGSAPRAPAEAARAWRQAPGAARTPAPADAPDGPGAGGHEGHGGHR